MANAVTRAALPAESFLNVYTARGEYTDCYRVDIPVRVSLADFVFAFYTTWLFKLERMILARFASKGSADDGARLLALGHVHTFAAWSVERRGDFQILLGDYLGRTCSWLMVANAQSPQGDGSVLYFGSAVMLSSVYGSDQLARKRAFNALLVFHKLYSRALLYLAARRAVRLAGRR